MPKIIEITSFQVLKNFLDTAEAEVRLLISLYSEVVSLVHFFLVLIVCFIAGFSPDTLSYREEMLILCPSTLGRIQPGVLLNKV